MARSKYQLLHTRVPADIAQAIYAMATPANPPYKVLQSIILGFVQASQRPPLRDDTMKLIYHLAALSGYDDVDALIRDLCNSLERSIRANKGELMCGEAEVDNDILEMFSSVINEKEVTIRKHS